MTGSRAALGQRGETAAASFLKRQGYEVLARNYHSRYGEIDIIACKDGRLAFVEVKTRSSLQYDTPGAAVNFLKQRKIRKTALIWLQAQDKVYEELAFDVVEILVSAARPEQAKLRWLKSCF